MAALYKLVFVQISSFSFLSKHLTGRHSESKYCYLQHGLNLPLIGHIYIAALISAIPSTLYRLLAKKDIVISLLFFDSKDIYNPFNII